MAASGNGLGRSGSTLVKRHSSCLAVGKPTRLKAVDAGLAQLVEPRRGAAVGSLLELEVREVRHVMLSASCVISTQSGAFRFEDPRRSRSALAVDARRSGDFLFDPVVSRVFHLHGQIFCRRSSRFGRPSSRARSPARCNAASRSIVRDHEDRVVGPAQRCCALGNGLQRVDVEAANRFRPSGRASGFMTAIWKISLRFFSPPEKPSLMARFMKLGSIFSSFILSLTSLRNSTASSSFALRCLRTALTAALRK